MRHLNISFKVHRAFSWNLVLLDEVSPSDIERKTCLFLSLFCVPFKVSIHQRKNNSPRYVPTVLLTITAWLNDHRRFCPSPPLLYLLLNIANPLRVRLVKDYPSASDFIFPTSTPQLVISKWSSHIAAYCQESNTERRDQSWHAVDVSCACAAEPLPASADCFAQKAPKTIVQTVQKFLPWVCLSWNGDDAVASPASSGVDEGERFYSACAAFASRVATGTKRGGRRQHLLREAGALPAGGGLHFENLPLSPWTRCGEQTRRQSGLLVCCSFIPSVSSVIPPHETGNV